MFSVISVEATFSSSLIHKGWRVAPHIWLGLLLWIPLLDVSSNQGSTPYSYFTSFVSWQLRIQYGFVRSSKRRRLDWEEEKDNCSICNCKWELCTVACVSYAELAQINWKSWIGASLLRVVTLQLNRFNPCLWIQHCYFIPAVIYTSSTLTSSLHLSISAPPSVWMRVCVSGREVLVCVNVHSVRVDMCRMINLCFAGGRESRCMWLFLHGTMVWFFFGFLGGCVLFDTVSNPASPLVRLQECCEHSGLPSPSLSVFFVCRLKTCLPVQEWLSVWLPASLCAMQFWPNLFCLSHIGSFDVVCFLIFWHPPLPFAAALCEQEAVQQCLRVSVFVRLSLPSLCLLINPPIRPSGASRTVEMQSVPKTAWILLSCYTNPLLSFTNWFSPYRLHSYRWLTDPNARWLSTKKIQIVLTTTLHGPWDALQTGCEPVRRWWEIAVNLSVIIFTFRVVTAAVDFLSENLVHDRY